MHLLRNPGRAWIVLVVSAVLSAWTIARAQRTSGIEINDIPQQVTVRLISLQVESVTSDHVNLEAKVAVTPQVSAVLQDVVFASMWLDRKVPIFLTPLHGSFTLHAGKETELPTIPVLVYFDDLSSMESLQRILDARSTHLSGEARANLTVSLLGKLVLRSTHPYAISVLDQDVQVLPSSVSLPATVGVHAAALAESVSHSVQDLLGIQVERREEHPWAASLLHIHTSYRIQAGTDTMTESVDRIGFWVGPHVAAFPDEALHPWAYSATEAERIARIGGKVDEASLEITVHPLESEARPWSLSQGDFRIEPSSSVDSERVVLPSRPHGIELRKRNSAGNLALLRFRDGISGTPIPLITSHASAGQAVIYRFAATDTDSRSAVSILPVRMTMDGSAVHLERPVSSTAFGSPILLEDGSVGMVQSEDGGADISILMNHKNSHP